MSAETLVDTVDTVDQFDSTHDDGCERGDRPVGTARLVRRRHPATRTARAALESDRQHGAVMPPLVLSSNFTFEGFARPRQYDYTRSGNPTRDALAAALADLEGGRDAVVTASGMAAITLVCQLLRPRDLLLAPHDCYGGSHRLFTTLAERGNFRVAFRDQTANDLPRWIRARCPRLVWIETPSNPLLRVVDIERTAQAAHEVGALVVVDNTFLSPLLQQPIALGADLVVHSTTKSINGHSDVVGGAVVAASAAGGEELRFWANCLGLTGAPFDSYMTLRGLRTLPLRWRAHEENAGAVAELLARHPAVAEAIYPGLEQHPQHQLARRQQQGFGAIVAARLRGGEEAVRTFVESLECFSLAESLGGVESLVSHPATMTHASMSPQARRDAGIDERLLRFAIGVEDRSDLVGDLEQALERAARAA
ncbi:MAG: cystathionine gamma-synthase [Acidobacteria bacterium]|nr:MAG: cystathionine gamma-synthase [Acidobacteriota bacterium]REK11255.1 MAG: cystathionine gamma-synthase [Acidobacteriota bacterium]